MSEERLIKVSRTAAYQVLGSVDNPVESITLACHGYGQLASYIVSKFTALSDCGHALVSAEGLNKFYWQGVSGEPVATWMTKKNRLEEISDFSEYLSRLNKNYIQKTNKKKLLLGFSQGGTTIWRWLHRCQPEFDVFINWAGWIPEDIDLSILTSYLKGKKLIFIYGKDDEYLSEERIEMMHQIIEKNRLNVEIIQFEGGHRIDREILYSLYKR